MERGKRALSAERFAQGMTFDEYVLYTGSPENLAREAGWWLGTDPAESPNADVVNTFLNEKDGQTFQSVPTAVFLTKGLEEIYRYIELPPIYHKARLAAAMQAAARGENREQAWEQFIRDWGALQALPFYQMWASAAVDEMLSALHERLVVATGSVS